ncbi:hypothetical protein AK830_g5404 [Neonectria ditissima]|uniref:CBM-cenC domain-containing protein n=1 Tax=Neonectria ditissima TaxID=78410 RepID=A0A0P7BJ25_9HYPO|nr:hypothetical protein AK830_g5404 [Neonectria ditissima]
MRWLSLCAVLGALLLPASAAPCRPDTTTTATTTASTTTATSEPTASILNGDFEGADLSVWQERTVTIVENAQKAHSGTHYARYIYSDEYAWGGNNLNQTITDLDVTRLYRLSFSGAVFGLTNLNGETCQMEALLRGNVKKSWPITNFVSGAYSSYSTDLTVDDEDLTLTLRLRCTTQHKVSIEFGVDDISLKDIGAAPSAT